jgi:predicted transcriptional regulator
MRDSTFLLWLISREPGKRKTHYQYQTRWDDAKFRKIVKALERRGFIVRELDGGKHKYKITINGHQYLYRNGSKHAFLLVELIEKRGPICTGELYETYCAECRRRGIKPATLYYVKRIMKELERRGVIALRMVYGGKHGNTTVYEVTHLFRRA